MILFISMHSLMNPNLDIQKYGGLADWHFESQKPTCMARYMAHG